MAASARNPATYVDVVSPVSAPVRCTSAPPRYVESSRSCGSCKHLPNETYVAIRIIGSVPCRLVATILSLIPGCQADAWMSDYAMPERAVAPEE